MAGEVPTSRCQALTLDLVVMGRPLRKEYPSSLNHITSRGNERRKIFLYGSDRLWLDDYHERYGILIHSYVLRIITTIVL